MDKEIEKKFIDEFPQFFQDMYGDPMKTCMSFGLCIGVGWRDLLWKLCEDIQAINPPEDFKFSQIKEKFGGLRAYYDGGNEEVWDLVNKAEQDSFNVCEGCGSRESITTEGGWLITLCKTCREKNVR